MVAEISPLTWWFYGVTAAGVLAAVVMLALFIFGLIRGLREGEAQDRARTNRCMLCGYPLKGNESGICPECGSVAESSGSNPRA